MPFVQIPPASLDHLSLFGYDIIVDDGNFAWYHGPRGRTRVEKAKPVVWLDDLADAMQLGATAIMVHPTVN
jgi:hypothetical protein